MSIETPKYPFLEYLSAGDPIAIQEALLGSAIRAVGKEWKVGVLSSSPIWKSFFDLLSTEEQSSFFMVDPSSPSALDLLILDEPDQYQIKLRFHENIRGKTHVMLTDSDTSEAQLQVETSYDLISVFRSQLVFPSPEGQVSAIVGGGKGKTTAALGRAFRLSPGKKVGVVQWFKERATGRLTWSINEHFFPQKLQNPDLWQFYPTGAGFFGSPALDRVTGDEAAQVHRKKAQEGLQIASELLATDLGALVLDELLDTLQEVMPSLPAPLLFMAEVHELLLKAQKKNIPIIVTGRKVPDTLREIFESVTEITSLRHPWADQKRGAVSGLDF